MKLLNLLICSCFFLAAQAQVQPPAVIQPGVNQPVLSGRKVQIAILFDTSNSMDGLIEQAKSTIWQIVNAAANLRVNGEIPKLEIALYDYGNSGITNANYVRLQTGLIGDLDSISGKLFALATNGGDEYCGAVIEDALANLQWSTNPEDLKLIYIAGNEPFNQGPADYKKVLANAANSGVIVNTIYCGPYDKGVQELWYDGSLISQGNYFNIDSNRDAFHIDTPYDKEINAYNDSLNTTYMGYGGSGRYRMDKQAKEDANASSKGMGSSAERAISKSNGYYDNGEWDLIDAQKNKEFSLDSIKASDLPEELKGKSREEQQKIIDGKRADRERYQSNINDLARKRSEYIDVEKKKLQNESGQEDLGTSIIKSMNGSAEKKGYAVNK